jgi:hypothetical protein
VKGPLLDNALVPKLGAEPLKLGFTAVIVPSEHSEREEGITKGPLVVAKEFRKIAMISASIWISPIESSDLGWKNLVVRKPLKMRANPNAFCQGVSVGGQKHYTKNNTTCAETLKLEDGNSFVLGKR